MEYFNEYKDVDNICKDMYGENGVKAYIEDMENNSSRKKMFVAIWEKEHRKLIHLKTLRNKIAHENGSYEVTEQDLFDIKTFHQQLLTQEDPIALLNKEIANANKRQESDSKPKIVVKPIPQQPYNNTSYKKSNKSRTLAIIACIAIAIIALIVLLLFLK